MQFRQTPKRTVIIAAGKGHQTSLDIMRATLIAKGTDITVLWATGLGSLDVADMVAAASAKGAACTRQAAASIERAQHVHAPWM